MLVGFLPLYKTAAKQNARLIAPWIVIISALCVTSFLAYAWIFPTLIERKVLAATIASNPAFSLIFGPGHNLLSADGFNAWRSLALGCFFAGLMAIFVVVRETRAKEDSGEAELVGANVVGRYTQLAVAVVLACMASVVLGIIASTATILVGGNITSSIMLGLAFTASGIMFASVAAVTSQLGSYASTANSIAVTFLGVCFLVRGYADTSPDADWALWLTPFGWLQKIEPAGMNESWPLLFCAGFAVIVIVIAGLLSARRDFGEGIIPTRPGKERAGLVRNVFGLAFRLQRGSVVSWTIAFILLGSVFGFLISSLGDVFTHNVAIAKLLSGGNIHVDLVFEFIGTLLKIMGVIAAVYGVQIMMRVYGEEMAVRVEPLLAGTTSRQKFYVSHVLIALVGPAIAITLGGCMIAFISTLRGVDINAWNIIKQAVVEMPAIWVLICLSVAMIGAHPIVRFGAWLAIVATFVLTIFGPTFKLWDWVQGISPLWHVPNVIEVSPDWIQLVWLSLIVAAFLCVGFIGLRRRDIARV
jgi:ABC-2 type transport system permease protein